MSGIEPAAVEGVFGRQELWGREHEMSQQYYAIWILVNEITDTGGLSP
jgi:hypothetical protein